MKAEPQAGKARQPAPLRWQERRQAILTTYFGLLAAAKSPLLEAGPDVEAQLAAQLLSIVDEAAGEAGLTGQPHLSRDIGRARASSGVHPSVSLAAARLIFEAALPDLIAHLDAGGEASAATTAAVRLNGVILGRMADAAANYVGYLLDKADQAHRDEAMRLSRDLHDSLGPMIAVAVQSLDLSGMYRSSDADRSEEKLALARSTLVDAAAALRVLATETRINFEPGHLLSALQDYLSNLPSDMRGKLSSTGTIAGIPSQYEREAFLILREAVRNAATHSRASAVSVDVAVSGIMLTGVVHDNGVGLDSPSAGRGGTGMDSMRERAALLGAELDVTTSAVGTTVRLCVPLPNRT
jgi:signal transduction histidine kinase